jgi:sulfonate transport system ATP-binding protein
MLSVEKLSKHFITPDGKHISALDNCSLELGTGSFTVIVGRSGCGKTTLLKIIAGLERADSGSVQFDTAALRLGFMFQDPRLLPWLTVEKNLRLAFLGTGPSNSSPSKMDAEIDRVLAMVGLGDRKKSYPAQLSGGMAQRASLARCLCRKPELLLLDEPLSALDAFTRGRLQEELAGLWKKLGLTIILVTHDIDEAVYLGDRVLLMDQGSIIEEISIPLGRPRDRHSGEFQGYSRALETSMGNRHEL